MLCTGFFIFIYALSGGDFGGVEKKCDEFTFILAGLLVQWQGFKKFSWLLKSCQRVERVRKENLAGLDSEGVLLRGVLLFEGNHQSRISRAGKNFSNDFALFS